MEYSEIWCIIIDDSLCFKSKHKHGSRYHCIVMWIDIDETEDLIRQSPKGFMVHIV